MGIVGSGLESQLESNCESRFDSTSLSSVSESANRALIDSRPTSIDPALGFPSAESLLGFSDSEPARTSSAGAGLTASDSPSPYAVARVDGAPAIETLPAARETVPASRSTSAGEQTTSGETRTPSDVRRATAVEQFTNAAMRRADIVRSYNPFNMVEAIVNHMRPATETDQEIYNAIQRNRSIMTDSQLQKVADYFRGLGHFTESGPRQTTGQPTQRPDLNMRRALSLEDYMTQRRLGR